MDRHWIYGALLAAVVATGCGGDSDGTPPQDAVTAAQPAPTPVGGATVTGGTTAPTGGTVAVSPLSGVAGAQDFSLSTTGWTDAEENLPLAFAFAYVTRPSAAALAKAWASSAVGTTGAPFHSVSGGR